MRALMKEWTMHPRITWITVTLAALCSACDGSVDALFQRGPFDTHDGPISAAEIDVLTSDMAALVGAGVAACVKKEALARATQVGDPQTLNPKAVDLMPAQDWDRLDKPGKRLILTQVVINQAIAVCTRAKTP